MSVVEIQNTSLVLEAKAKLQLSASRMPDSYYKHLVSVVLGDASSTDYEEACDLLISMMQDEAKDAAEKAYEGYVK